MSKHDAHLARIEKVKARRKRNCRVVVKALKADGTAYLRHADNERRKRRLRNGAEPRKGEKITGSPCTFQTGINCFPGRFERAARDLRHFRQIVAGGVFGPQTSKAYFENRIHDVIEGERRITKGIIREIRGT